jgi:hypothetical protein
MLEKMLQQPLGKNENAAHVEKVTDGPISTPSYFFFWAFSAAFVTLPIVTSLVVTL